MRVHTTTLWDYPSQQHGDGDQGDKAYVGATPSHVIWNVLHRYSREGDVVVDPFCGSGTTLDVARELKREGRGFDLNPTRPEIVRADARDLPLDDASAQVVFMDPPYGDHIDYSDDPRCIGKLDSGGTDGGKGYYEAMTKVTREIARVLKPGGHMALYVSDSHVKGRGDKGFMPIGFELFQTMRSPWAAGGAGLLPIDIVSVVRGNQKLSRGNWHAAAEEGNFFLRGFNYLFIMKKPPLPGRKNG